MRTAAAATLASLLLLAAACRGGGGTGTATFEVPRRSGTPTARAALHTVAPRELRPPEPARMFAGARSAVGQLVHYCRASRCADVEARAPAVYLAAPPGAFVLFTVAEAPVEARAEVRARPGEEPGIVELSPSTLMVFNHGLGRGRYLVDLVVRWRAGEARWRFGLEVT
jgi:hypothetical protein